MRKLVARPLEVVVDDADVVEPGHAQLLAGIGEPTLDGGLVLGAAATQPALELLGAGWLDEHEHGVGVDLADVEAALDVDLEHDGAAGADEPVGLAAQRAVAVAVDPRPLEKLSLLDEAVELRVVEEVVGGAVNLARSRGARRRRDRQAQAGAPLAEKRDERSLADA